MGKCPTTLAANPQWIYHFPKRDDTILDKRHAQKIALAQKQYSGNAHAIINGIGVTCVYVNPELDRYWIIDFRIYDKQGDGGPIQS